MNEQKQTLFTVWCLGVAAVLALVLALFMLLVHSAPRLGGRGEPGTRLTIYEGPATMQSSSAAAISANGTPFLCMMLW